MLGDLVMFIVCTEEKKNNKKLSRSMCKKRSVLELQPLADVPDGRNAVSAV